jgi:Viral BACON domain
METKRCTYCHKLHRVESRACSRCGRPFERKRSKGGRSWHSSVSLYSLPAASPHHVGHYSGLHPEDQPYQSNKMVTPQRFLQEMLEKEALQQEPKHIVLPGVHGDDAEERYIEVSQIPTRPQIPSRQSRQQLASDNTLPENLETQETDVGDRSRPQISRPFMQDVLPATQPSVESEAGPTSMTEPDPQSPLEDSLFSIADDTALLPEDLPPYMQEALHTRLWPSRIMFAVLVVVCFCMLLLTSTSVLALLRNRTDLHTPPKVPPRTPNIPTIVSALPHLQLSTTQVTFGSSASGVVSSQTITLKNSGGGQVVWQENSDKSWLTTSPKSGTFANSEDIQITINRGAMTSGDYTGHVAFLLQGQENTPAVLNVTMTVAPTPAQLSISTTSLSYSTVQGQIPESQVIAINNMGEQALHWDATTGAPWLTLSLYHGVIAAGMSQPLTVSVASQNLPIGTYRGLISFTGDAHAQVEVSLTVVPPGHLTITPSSLTLTAQQTSQTLSLQNSGGLSLDWTLKSSTDDNGNSLSATPSSGTLAPGASITVTVHADSTSLSAGSCQGMLTFAAGDQTEQVSVSLVVTEATPTPVPTPTATSTPMATSTSVPTRRHST